MQPSVVKLYSFEGDFLKSSINRFSLSTSHLTHNAAFASESRASVDTKSTF